MDFLLKTLIGLFIIQSINLNQASAVVSSGANDCISKEEIATIAGHFKQFNNLTGKEYCFDGSETANLIKAIVFMRKTAFEQNMPKSNDELFSGTFASEWWGYFIGRITEFEVQKSCPNGVGAYVMPFFGMNKTMYVCPLMLSTSFSALDRASVFMHEARHIDGFPHTTCTKGPRKGLQGACDVKIADRGSYGVTVETYAQLAKYAKDLHPALKAYSKASSIIYAKEAFENVVKIDSTPKFLIMTNDKNFHELDIANGTKVKSLGVTPVLGKIIMRAENMVLFPEDKTLPAGYVFANNEGSLEQSPGVDVDEYNKQNEKEKLSLITIHYGTQFKAKVVGNIVKMACDPKSPTLQDYSLPTGAKPQTFIYPEGYSREPKLANLQTEDGKVFEVGCQGTSGYVKQTTMTFDRLFKRIYKNGSQTLGLTADGNLFKISNGTSTPVQTNLQGSVFEIAPSFSYNFFD